MKSPLNRKKGLNPSSTVMLLEQHLLFQPEQHKVHLHVHTFVVSEISTGHPKEKELKKLGHMWAQL